MKFSFLFFLRSLLGIFIVIHPAYAQVLPKDPSAPTGTVTTKITTDKGGDNGQKMILKIITDTDCVLKVDGEVRGRALAGQICRIKLGAGEFILSAADLTNRRTVYTQSYSVSKDQLGTEVLLRLIIKDRYPARPSESGLVQDIEKNMVHVVGKGMDFYLNKFEVTQKEWKAAMGDNPSANAGCDSCPVEYVSWNDVQRFLRVLNANGGYHFRLPTEAEWEYAAQGGELSKGYAFSGSNRMQEVAAVDAITTMPVGRMKPNELRLYDMTGNVWEWCADWCDADQQLRVIRGGSYLLSKYQYSQFRGCRKPQDQDGTIGFRLAQDVTNSR